MVTPCWTVGGVERWFLSILHRSERVDWAGVVVTSNQIISREMIDATRRYCPVDIGAEHVPELLDRCDVLILWGNDDARPWVEKWPGKIVLVSHGTGEWTRLRMAQYADLAAATTAVSEAATIPFPPDVRKRTRVIHNGIEYDRLAPSRPRAEIRKSWGLEPTDFAVGYCGRWSNEKRPASAAIAASRIPGSVAVYMVPEFSRALGQAAVPGICGDRARWHTGSVGDLFAGLDCLVAASEHEGFALAITEAWAAGCPVVATAVGAIPEMEREFGPLTIPVPQNPTPEQLADAVRQAATPAARAIVARARAVAWERLSAARMTREWEELFLEVAG